MKAAGIIAEYNPFHNGHAYHVEETRKRTGADFIVAVMSGNFVQRGAPAILNKYERTRMALENGIDLVIELPVTAALSSAEGFASGGIALLDGLGVITDVSFGAEVSTPGDIGILCSAAGLLARETPDFQKKLSLYLKQGYSFPAARTMALLDDPDIHSGAQEDVSALLSSPNNILAIEYLKALEKYESSIHPCLISRMGSGYHTQELENEFASASAIRKYLLSAENALYGDTSNTVHRAQNSNESQNFPEDSTEPKPSGWPLLAQHVPPAVCQTLARASEVHCLLQENDFSDMLFYALNEHAQETEHYGSSNADFSLRLNNMLEQYETWSQFALALKSKNQTYTAISRYLSHVLLGITREHLALAAQFRFAPYARVLGFKKNSAPLIKEIRKKGRIDLITRLAKERDCLSDRQRYLLDLDIRASEIYNRAVFSKSGEKIRSDYRQPLICQ